MQPFGKWVSNRCICNAGFRSATATIFIYNCSTRHHSADEKWIYSPVIFQTEDGGTTWREQAIPEAWGGINDLYALDAAHAWASGDAGTFYLERGRWKLAKPADSTGEDRDLNAAFLVASGAPPLYPLGIHFLNSELGWISNVSGATARSRDGGKTWQGATGPEEVDWSSPGSMCPHFVKFHFPDPIHGYALEENGMLHETQDGGRSWKRLDLGVVLDDLCFTETQEGWGVGEGAIFRIITPGLSPE